MTIEHYNITSFDGLIEMTVAVRDDPYQDLDNNVRCTDLDNNEKIVVQGWNFEWELIKGSAAENVPAADGHADVYLDWNFNIIK